MTPTPQQTLNILHTADVHLDLDGYISDARTPSTRHINHRAFSSVIDLAIQEDVDLLLIAGDLFDSNRPRRDVVDFAIQELRRVGKAAPGGLERLYWMDYRSTTTSRVERSSVPLTKRTK